MQAIAFEYNKCSVFTNSIMVLIIGSSQKTPAKGVDII